ncbi:MAG: nitronate monooxygenase family protein, partial [Actinobacteria bacterium]|nr:nitronate monooxygenase family protein [Actinomycetota bacterium]
IKLEQDLLTMVPDEHRRFVKKILADHNVPELPVDELPPALIGWTEATASPLIDAALRHPKVRLIANALGTPPDEVIQRVHESGRLIAALCGSPKQALHHKDANVDIIIAQGTEGGGHTGDVGSVVLWPQVIDAVYPIPVLAAGGIGTGRQVAAALAMGAEGVWTGSIWLTVEEADQAPAQVESLLAATSRDTVRSRSWTGKPCRMLRNEWTDAWEDPANPDPLGMPLQFMVTGEAVARGHHYSQQAKDVNFNPVGQIVGTMNKVRKTKDLIADMVDEYLECSNRLERLNERAAGAEVS